MKAGQIKKARSPAALDRTMAPYEIPPTWEWAPLGETINSHLGGGTPSKNNSTYWDGDIFWASVKDVGKGKYIDETIDRITEAGLADSSSNLIPTGSLIVVTRMGLGKVSINRVPIAINQDLRALSLSSLVSIYYHYNFFKTHGFEGTGLTVKGIKVEELLNIPFPLPPLTEQHRIVAKVDELMALCDRLEASQAERENRRDRVVAASLHRLNNGADAGSFRDHARFYFDHLPRLTTKPEHIQQLRQTILNLAVRGKLVPQDTRDQHAPEFGIEKETSETNRIQLRLPSSWSWTRVENVAESRLGKMLDKAKNSGKPYRYLRNTNVHWFNIKLEELKVLRIEADEVEKYVLRNGDVLICEGGHGIGRTAVWRGMEPKIVFQKALHRVRPGLALNSDFFAYCICVYFHSGVLQTYFTGVGIPHFTGVALSKLVFPLPPLAEQQRIVAKVDELMAICDKLEAQLTTTHTESRRLLEAVLHEALAPAVAS